MPTKFSSSERRLLTDQKVIPTLQRVIDLLKTPNMPVIPGAAHETHRIASFLEGDLRLLGAPGPLEERQYVIGDIRIARDYFLHPLVVGLKIEPSPPAVIDSLNECLKILR